ncbi:tetratricopeptide repeat protein [Oleiagrimonas soli]|uniref:Cytochrome C biogenesis protein CcmI n=1 Tax=Oleiagrimonas soli TaxID=1543381 RepID=A0A099CV71_9GAMM|nr:tetratricopeptide repeat protein [Oleiagrimonas soli]KGI77551.1 cytochrome C biogenesis protein CcmI [Oleiagrimonas soli]MBB6182972.1 cytochrome c-type biogenesis protein CcmH [Oleiagrimonas soli]
MKTAFTLTAILMTLIALALIVLPMLRSGRRHGRPRHVLVLSLLTLFALPLAALGLYLHVGTPAALDKTALQPQMTLDQAIAKLRAELKQHPDNLQGWVILGRTYAGTDRPAAAREAYTQALKLAPDNADLMVAWAEVDGIARSDHRIEGRARSLLQRAVKADPRNQRGLWLLGISDYQHGHFADAVLTWRRLQALLQPGSKVAEAVKEQIAMANARAAGKTQEQALALLQSPASASSASTAAPADADQGAHLAVRVTLAPNLRAQVKPDDTLYVFAKAPNGPPMPLAVARLKASALPTTVMLTDGMGMTPAMRLSSVPEVTVTARISRSGRPTATAGDLEGSAGPVSVHAAEPVDVTIDHVH